MNLIQLHHWHFLIVQLVVRIFYHPESGWNLHICHAAFQINRHHPSSYLLPNVFVNVYSTPQNARRDHIVKIVIPAFIKQHIVQDFMMGRSWVFILHPFPNKRHISNRLRRKPKHSHTHGQRRKLSEKLAFRDAARRCHRHGNCSKAGDAVSCWWLNQPTYFF